MPGLKEPGRTSPASGLNSLAILDHRTLSCGAISGQDGRLTPDETPQKLKLSLPEVGFPQFRRVRHCVRPARFWGFHV